MTIFSKPSSAIKTRLTAEWFGIANKDNAGTVLEGFFDYYEEELKLLRVGASEDTWLGACLAVKEHEDILTVVQFLRANQEKTKDEIQLLLSSVLPNNDVASLYRSIDLGVRLWLMINVRDSKFQSLRPLDTCLQWPVNQTLGDFVESIFVVQGRKELPLRDARFDVNFTAASMIAICGLRIHWTTNIHDHLLLNRRKRILSMFAYEHQIEFAGPLGLVRKT